MDEFRLAEGVYLTTGAKRGALHHTKSGNVFSINEAARRILEGEATNTRFCRQLVEMGLAIRGSTGTNENPSLPKQEIKLSFIWFEIISDDCNQRCIHCYAGSIPSSYDRGINIDPLNAKEPHPRHRKLTYQEWLRLIEEGYDIGCRKGQFIGGEPFLYRGETGETVLDLAEYACNLGYEHTETFTNATLLTPRQVARIKHLGLRIAVSLYSDDPNVHDGITRTPGSHKKTLAALERLRKAEVPTRVEVVLMRTNQATAESTIKLISEMGFESRPPDVLRPTGRGDDPALLPSPEVQVQYGLIAEPSFYANEGYLMRCCSGHSCLAGKLTITDTGDVLPCIFSRTQVAGNVIFLGSLKEVIAREPLQAIWHTTKDTVLVCQDCEYRYVCFDCRPISEAVAGDRGDYLTAPYPRCTYNPYTGEWAGGAWRLDEVGQPYYDRTIAPIAEAKEPT